MEVYGSVIKQIKASYRVGRSLCSRIYRHFLKRYNSHIAYIKSNPSYAAEKRGLPCDVVMIKQDTLRFIGKMRKQAFNGHHKWFYFFSPSAQEPILYASIFTVLTFSLYGMLEKISSNIKNEWAEFIQGYQTDNGLFQDPLIDCPLAESVPWWGWQHLSLHALMALSALGQIAKKELGFIKRFYDPIFFRRWLNERNWNTEAANVSNEVQNIGVALQYARDFHHTPYAQDCLEVMFDWLNSHQNPLNGSWDESSVSVFFKQKRLSQLSQLAQTGYHIWLLYFYDKRPLRYVEQIIDLLLETQNKRGGFGVSLNSSACEDIDSIDPLVRLMKITNYRKDDIIEALEKSLPWILMNANSDGGWVFRRMEATQIGPKFRWSAKADESAMFPTWFRTLTLAYLSKALPEKFIGKERFQFIHCPGHQFW